jgi:hypothetical protein
MPAEMPVEMPVEMIDALGGLLPRLLVTLERVGWVQRQLYPPLAARLAQELAPCADAMAGPLREVEALACPDELRFMRIPLVEAARQTLDLVTAFVEAAQPPGEPMGLYRALRRFARVQETLYPLAHWMFPIHTARLARQALLAAGARLVYREIEDLSHTYLRDENPRILDWLTGDGGTCQ